MILGAAVNSELPPITLADSLSVFFRGATAVATATGGGGTLGRGFAMTMTMTCCVVCVCAKRVGSGCVCPASCVACLVSCVPKASLVSGSGVCLPHLGVPKGALGARRPEEDTTCLPFPTIPMPILSAPASPTGVGSGPRQVGWGRQRCGMPREDAAR